MWAGSKADEYAHDAEGGVYADLDVEAFQSLDEVLLPLGEHATAHLFEEPATHWDAHDTVISNGMMAAPVAHPLLLAVLRSIRPHAVLAEAGVLVFLSSSARLALSLIGERKEEDEAEA